MDQFNMMRRFITSTGVEWYSKDYVQLFDLGNVWVSFEYNRFFFYWHDHIHLISSNFSAPQLRSLDLEYAELNTVDLIIKLSQQVARNYWSKRELEALEILRAKLQGNL